jgi:hypothetical protein
MALMKQVSTTDNFGRKADFPSAYVKVSFVSGNNETVNADVVVYASNPKENTVQVVKNEQYKFSPNLDGPNFIKQAYEHLKTLPEFAGAADV